MKQLVMLFIIAINCAVIFAQRDNQLLPPPQPPPGPAESGYRQQLPISAIKVYAKNLRENTKPSNDPGNPTPLTANSIRITLDGLHIKHMDHYYTFAAGPGEASVVLYLTSPRGPTTATMTVFADDGFTKLGAAEPSAVNPGSLSKSDLQITINGRATTEGIIRFESQRGGRRVILRISIDPWGSDISYFLKVNGKANFNNKVK